jgi:DNA-binding NtrC family response regulator
MYNILILDDQSAIINAMRRAIDRIPSDLLDSRCRVHGFDNPKNALESLRDVAYDAVISDLRMPGVDGLDFLRQARDLQPDAVRILISGYGDLPSAMAAINDIGVFRFVAKPWDDAELQLTLVSALQTRTMQRENQRLADEVRVQRGQLSEQDARLRELESECPGITRVERDDTGAIVLGEHDL